MYKTAIRAMIRSNIRQLNAGDASGLLKMASNDMTIAFPGDNSWATMFRPAEPSREPHNTHRGIDECRAFAARFAKHGVQFDIEDILVNGAPWNLRIALRVKSFVPSSDSSEPDEYNNRAMAVLEVRWGKLVRWEDYEDTQRVADWDRCRSESSAVPG